MLESLTIRHVALIDEATICFHPGMQVMTGETGAGKSIVVDSVNLILGGRADRDLIRTGCEKASVEAAFSVRNNRQVLDYLKEEGIDCDDTLTIYREISANGKNTCRVNGVMIPVSELKDLAAMLLDLHGQSDQLFLSDPAAQLAFLDQTGDEKHRKLLNQIREDYGRFIENHRAYAKLVRQGENREARMRSLERDLEELKKAHIENGEADQLLAKRKKLAEDEKTARSLNEINTVLTGEEDGSSCLGKIKDTAAVLRALSVQDDQIREISERCDNLYYELEDIAYQISMLNERNGYEPGALEKTDNRLDLIHRIERKHGVDANEIPGLLESMEKEYRFLEELEQQISDMSSEHKRLLGCYRNTAKALSASRKNLAAAFENKMMRELNDLGMENTRFVIQFTENETGKPVMPTENGDDRVEYMISPNPGEPVKPLARIASGGELSRIMLAVKTLESAHTGVDSMVFDEIDTGISGRMAQVVADKMIMISKEKQVICVTHLPQIAAAADYQYLVRKRVEDGRTHTSVTELDEEGRIGEVGRMISGADGMTEESKTYASGMIQAALKQKKER